VQVVDRGSIDATFERRLRAAVSAGWRVLVVEVAFVTLVWVLYVAIAGAHPTAMLALWGPDVTWSTVATVSLQAIAACKVAIWLQVALLAWAWLWASTLRKPGAESAEPRSEFEGTQVPEQRAGAALAPTRMESAPEHAPSILKKPASATTAKATATATATATRS
jgi:hypothetical protein